MRAAWRVHHREVVGSTMEEVRLLAAAGAPHGTTVSARQQTAGRGRHGRVWATPRDSGVALTTLLRPAPQAGLERLSLVAGVAVWEALVALGAPVQLKWPNDVVAREGKLAGVLLEADGLDGAAPCIFVGIGINWAAREAVDWSEARGARPIGLQDLMPAPPPPPEVAQAVIHSLQRHWDGFLQAGLQPVLDVWRQADALQGRTVRVEVDGKVLQGTAAGLATDGQLVVCVPQGRVTVGAGEVTCVRPEAAGAACSVRGSQTRSEPSRSR